MSTFMLIYVINNVYYTNMKEEILKKIKINSDNIDRYSYKIDEMSKKINWIFNKLLDHDERLISIEQNMATKDDLRGISDTLDKLVGLFEKKDQETTMISHGMKRHEKRIEKLETDVEVMKPALGLS